MAPFKSSLAKSVGKLLGVSKETDLSLRGDVQSTRRITPIVTFDTLVIMVAGGGAGGGGANGADGGGGGGGEVKFGPLTLQSEASYVFRAGDGGPAPGNNTPTGENGTGTPSFISSPLFTTVTAQGGGGGGTGGSNVPPNGGYGAPGGSGGGGGGDGTAGSHNQPGGSSTAAPATDPDYYSFTGYGNAGGIGGEDGGGGGGAAPGGTGASGAAGAAGDGIAGKTIDDFAYPLIQPAVPSPIQPTFGPQVGPGGYFGGGGCMGGEGTEPANRHPNGGGGGGPGNSNNPGTELTGGGGAGRESSNPGGNGGAGVIIMRVPTSNAPQVTVPGGVTSVAPGNGYKYFLFSGVATTSYPVSVAPG